MKRFILISIALLALASTALAAPKYKDDPSTWSIKVGDSYLVFKFPQRIFLCPFNELGGGVATRFGGRGMHWMEIAHPMSRGTNCHYWVEIIDAEGKLADHAKKFSDDSLMNTTYNEVTTKGKVEKTILAGKTAYTGTYKSKMLSTLSKQTFEVNGAFWMLDIDKARVVIQADAFRENYDCVPTLLKAVSIGKKAEFTDFKIAQTTATTYRYLSLPMFTAPAMMTQTPDGSLCTWSVTDAAGEEIGSIKLRQTFLGETQLDEWKENLLTSLRARNIEKPENLVVKTKVADRDAFSIDFPVITDDAKKRPAYVRNICFNDGSYAVEIYAISYNGDKTKAAAVWGLLDKPMAGMILWSAGG